MGLFHKRLRCVVAIGLTLIGLTLPLYARASAKNDCPAIITYTNSALGGDQEALHKLKQLADHGNAFAQAMMVEILTTDSEKYVVPGSTDSKVVSEYGNKAAHSGNALGIYLNGEVNFVTGEMWGMPDRVAKGHEDVLAGVAALQKDITGQCSAPYILALAQANARGEAGPQDFTLVLRLVHQAAASGYLPAMANLADLYAWQKLSYFDIKKAVHWTRKAAKLGYLPSITMMGDLYKSGEGVAQSPAKAFLNYKRASDRHYPVAEFKLANAYLEGLGTPVNDRAALALLLEASTSGYPPAQREAFELSLQMMRDHQIPGDPKTLKIWNHIATARDWHPSTDLPHPK